MVLQSGLCWTMIWISNKEMVYLGAAITGLGWGFLWCILPVVIMDNSDKENAQRNMSFLWLAFSLGATVGGLLNYFYFDGVTKISVENRELVYSVSAGLYIFAGLVAAIGLSDVREKSQRQQDTPIFKALSWFKRMIRLPAFWFLGLPLIYWGFIWGYFVKILPTAIPSISDSRNLIPLTTVIHGACTILGATIWDLISRITNTVTCVILATLMLLASLILSVLIIPKDAASEILDSSTIETYVEPDSLILVIIIGLIGLADCGISIIFYTASGRIYGDGPTLGYTTNMIGFSVFYIASMFAPDLFDLHVFCYTTMAAVLIMCASFLTVLRRFTEPSRSGAADAP